jgi:hemerythrin
MDLLLWDKKFSVHNDSLDAHHKQLFELCNEMFKQIDQESKTPVYSTAKVISELHMYAIFHFAEEEKLMEKYDFPKLDEHKKLHQGFIQKLAQLKEQYENDDVLVDYDILNFLSDWLIYHILEVDSEYIDYINE